VRISIPTYHESNKGNIAKVMGILLTNESPYFYAELAIVEEGENTVASFKYEELNQLKGYKVVAYMDYNYEQSRPARCTVYNVSKPLEIIKSKAQVN
jgi:hypothetical protein